MKSKSTLEKFGTFREYVNHFGYDGLPTVFKLVDDEILLTPKDIADLLNVDPETVRRWIRSGKLCPLSPIGKYTIMGSDLKEFLFWWHVKKLK